MKHKDSLYWDRIIRQNFEDPDLRCWVGSIIWWNENPCSSFNCYSLKSRRKAHSWEWFAKLYVDNYRTDHPLPDEALINALKQINYKTVNKLSFPKQQIAFSSEIGSLISIKL